MVEVAVQVVDQVLVKVILLEQEEQVEVEQELQILLLELESLEQLILVVELAVEIETIQQVVGD